MLPRLAALAAVVLWGVSFVATKAALAELSPLAVIAGRFALGGAFLTAFLIARGKPVVPPRGELWPLAVMGFVGVFVHQLLQTYGLTLTTATRAGWLIGLIPVWAAIIAAFFLRERFGPAALVGLALGFLGAALVTTGGQLDRRLFALPTTRGDLLVVASTLNWAIYTTIGNRTIRRIGSARASAAVIFLGLLMFLPFCVAETVWREYRHLSAAAWGAVLFLGIGCSALGYLLWYAALARLSAARVAAFSYLEPLVTMTAAAALLGESAKATTVAGGVIVLVGVYLTQRRK